MIEFDKTKNIYYQTKKEFVAESIRAAILAGDISAGTRVREKEIRELLGVSSTPVREAFQQLEVEGLLRKNTHVGAYVAPTATDCAREFYEMQAYLQSKAVKICAPRLSEEDLLEAEELNEAMKGVVASRLNVKELRHLNYQLHILICGVNVFPWLTRMISAIWVRIPRQEFWLLPQRPQRSIHQHAGIIKALRSRDGIEAGELMKDHLRCTMNDIFREEYSSTG